MQRIGEARHSVLWRESPCEILWSDGAGFPEVWSVNCHWNFTSSSTICKSCSQSFSNNSSSSDQQRRSWQNESAVGYARHQTGFSLWTQQQLQRHCLHWWLSTRSNEVRWVAWLEGRTGCTHQIDMKVLIYFLRVCNVQRSCWKAQVLHSLPKLQGLIHIDRRLRFNRYRR